MSFPLRRLTGIAITLALVVSGNAIACSICVPYPTRTVADRLVAAEAVVLARENPDKPWSFAPVETLKASPLAPPIDNFLNSSTRRLLKLNPERRVALTWDGSPDSKWESLGYADPEFERAVVEIVQRSSSWRHWSQDDPQRLEYFAGFLGHANRRLHELAYLEIGRAPYNSIKQLQTDWSPARIRLLLNDPLYFEWYPLAILLLAHKGGTDDHAYIEKRFEACAKHGITTNLSAWATALIEIKDTEGIRAVQRAYFDTRGRSEDELVAVLAALSEHGSFGRTHLRDTIVESYARLLGNYPQLVGYVVRDLVNWERWELAEQISTIADQADATDPLNQYAIKAYLSRARPSVLN